MVNDLIMRSDVLNLATCITKPTYDSPYCESVVYVEDIEAIPSVNVEPVRHGEWKHLGGDEWRCTVCGEVIYTEGSWEKPTYKYCYECGAKMNGGADNGR